MLNAYSQEINFWKEERIGGESCRKIFWKFKMANVINLSFPDSKNQFVILKEK